MIINLLIAFVKEGEKGNASKNIENATTCNILKIADVNLQWQTMQLACWEKAQQRRGVIQITVIR